MGDLNFHSVKMRRPSKVIISQTKRFEEYRFTWKIAHFLEIRNSSGALGEQKFYFEMGSRIGLPTKWKCSLKEFTPSTQLDKSMLDRSLQGEGHNRDCNNNWENKWIGVFFSLEEKPKDANEVWIRSRLQIYNTENNAHTIIGGGISSPVTPPSLYFDRISEVQNVVEGNTDWGFGQVLPQYEPESRLPLSSGGVLVLELLVTLYNYQVRNFPINLLELDTIVKKFEPVFLRKISQDMTKLCGLAALKELKTASTVTLISQEGQQFPIHRDVLFVRSPGLKHMLLTTLPNAEEIEVHGLSAEGLTVFLHFLYTGALTDNWSNPGVIETFIWTAHEFYKNPRGEGTDDLLMFLDHTAGLVCTAENAGKLLWLARHYGMERAEKSLFEYMQRHTADTDMFFSFAKDAVDGVKVTITEKTKKMTAIQWTRKRAGIAVGFGVLIFAYLFAILHFFM